MLLIVLLLAGPAFSKEITTEEALLSAARNAEVVGYLAIYTSPRPRAEVIRAWKPTDSAPLAAAVRRGINAYVLSHPALNPPQESGFFLFLCGGPTGVTEGVPSSFSEVELIPTEERCVMLEGKKISLDDIKKAIRNGHEKAESTQPAPHP
jgi:hypothetical protein